MVDSKAVAAAQARLDGTFVKQGVCTLCKRSFGGQDNYHNTNNFREHFISKHPQWSALVAESLSRERMDGAFAPQPSFLTSDNSVTNDPYVVKGRCTLCNVLLGQGNVYNITSHVSGVSHRTKVASKRAVPAIATKATASSVAIKTTGSAAAARDPYINSTGACTLCNTRAVGNIHDHIRGRTHQEKLATLRSSVPIRPASGQPAAPSSVSSYKGFCQLCRIDSGRGNLASHIAGFRHQARVRQHDARTQANAISHHVTSAGIWHDNTCALCNVVVLPTGDLRLTHENGKRHRQLLSNSSRSWVAPRLVEQLNSAASSQGLIVSLWYNNIVLPDGQCTITAARSSVLEVKIHNTGSTRLSAEWRIAPSFPFKSFTMPTDRTLMLQVGESSFRLTVRPTIVELGKVHLMLSLLIEGGKSIIRNLILNVMPPNSDSDRKIIAKTSEYHPLPRKKFVSISTGPSLDGVRRRRGDGPRNINKLPEFTMPLWIATLIADQTLLTQRMRHPLSLNNYFERFRTLLWLEEYHLHLNIQTFDMDNSILQKSSHNGLLKLEVLGLAEDRPSVMVGDTVRISQLAFGTKNVPIFGGSVHYVDQTHVHLRFHDLFIKNWVPLSKWFVRFDFGRVPLRRCHQALEVIGSKSTTTARVFPKVPLDTADTSNTAACNQWITANVFDKSIKVVGVSLETLTNSVRLGLIQVATSEACLVYYVGDKHGQALPSELVRLIKSPDITKYVCGSKGEDLLDQQFDNLHFCSGQDVQAKLNTLLEQVENHAVASSSSERDYELPAWSWPLNASLLDAVVAGAAVALQVGSKLDTSSKSLDQLSCLSRVLKQRQADPSLTYRPVIVNPPVNLYNSNLNAEQTAAVISIVTGSHHPAPFLLDGTPGSGKSTSIIESIRQLIFPTAPALIKQQAQRVRILVCAPSNAAADLIVDKMSQFLPPTRMYRLNAASRPQVAVPTGLVKYSTFIDGNVVQLELSQLRQFDLIVSTCMASASLYALGCDSNHFSHIFIDEAGQCTEPEVLVAMTGLIGPTRGHVILSGDPQQLGPVLQSKLIEKQLGDHSLSMSLLERLYLTSVTDSRSPYHPSHNINHRFMVRLVQNYRSHPAIIEQPNEMFYGGQLVARADVKQRESLQDWEGFPVRRFPVLFHHVTGTEDREGSSPSWFNEEEALQVVAYIEQLLAYKAGQLQPSEIGVISPYRQQCKRIRKLVERRKIDTNALKIGSVEEFQGSERRVIIISTVRSQLSSLEFDQQFRLGFVSHPKRLNVAITRAKAALIVVGNAQVLRADHLWRKFARFCMEHYAMIGATDPTSWFGVSNATVEFISDLSAHIGATGDNDEDESKDQDPSSVCVNKEESDDENENEDDVDELARE